MMRAMQGSAAGPRGAGLGIRLERRGGLWPLALAVASAFGLWACAHTARLPAPPADGPPLALDAAPEPDASTVALWHLDEQAGSEVLDAGSARLNGVAGIDSRPEFGRFVTGRRFTASINSFVLVPYSGTLDLGPAWTIEAWVKPSAYGPVELSVIASRWTESANEQSWVLGVLGIGRSLIGGAPPVPGLFQSVITRPGAGLIVLVLQPQDAGEPRAYTSSQPLDRDRWSHVAVTHDGSVLRFYLDGRLDAQYANVEAVRRSAAPLVLGNLIDPRWLVDAQGSQRVPAELGKYPFYAFEGTVDELRLSNDARIPAPRPHR
ncbi:MAG TPA: LamG domain-containing protein [Solirubrobacteraceae bacterium]